MKLPHIARAFRLPQGRFRLPAAASGVVPGGATSRPPSPSNLRFTVWLVILVAQFAFFVAGVRMNDHAKAVYNEAYRISDRLDRESEDLQNTAKQMGVHEKSIERNVDSIIASDQSIQANDKVIQAAYRREHAENLRLRRELAEAKR